jgi:hypothetical protein
LAQKILQLGDIGGDAASLSSRKSRFIMRWRVSSSSK